MRCTARDVQESCVNSKMLTITDFGLKPTRARACVCVCCVCTEQSKIYDLHSVGNSCVSDTYEAHTFGGCFSFGSTIHHIYLWTLTDYYYWFRKTAFITGEWKRIAGGAGSTNMCDVDGKKAQAHTHSKTEIVARKQNNRLFGMQSS